MIRGINRYSIFTFIIASLTLLPACDRNIIYSGSTPMDNSTWNLVKAGRYEVPIDDTTTAANVFFTIRTGSDYPFRNIWLFVSTMAPDGKIIGDTLQYQIIDEQGKRYGKGFGDIRELNLPYKSNIYFPVKGIYRFTVHHGMREEELKGVYDIGIRVEKVTR